MGTQASGVETRGLAAYYQGPQKATPRGVAGPQTHAFLFHSTFGAGEKRPETTVRISSGGLGFRSKADETPHSPLPPHGAALGSPPRPGKPGSAGQLLRREVGTAGSQAHWTGSMNTTSGQETELGSSSRPCPEAGCQEKRATRPPRWATST